MSPASGIVALDITVDGRVVEHVEYVDDGGPVPPNAVLRVDSVELECDVVRNAMQCDTVEGFQVLLSRPSQGDVAGRVERIAEDSNDVEIPAARFPELFVKVLTAAGDGDGVELVRSSLQNLIISENRCLLVSRSSKEKLIFRMPARFKRHKPRRCSAPGRR